MGTHAASLSQYYYTLVDHPVYAAMFLGEVLKQLGQWLTYLALYARIAALSSTPSVSLSLLLLARRLPYLMTVAFTGQQASARDLLPPPAMLPPHQSLLPAPNEMRTCTP
jgi:hypothetical protein